MIGQHLLLSCSTISRLKLTFIIWKYPVLICSLPFHFSDTSTGINVGGTRDVEHTNKVIFSAKISKQGRARANQDAGKRPAAAVLPEGPKDIVQVYGHSRARGG